MIKTMDNSISKKTWPRVGSYLSIHNKHDYELSLKLHNQLLDEVGTYEKHPLYGFLEALGVVIKSYEPEYYKWGNVSGLDVLKFLMQEHSLNQWRRIM